MRLVVAVSIFVLCFTRTALATNGMNLEGYGPIASGMGGASMAYDNGAAAMMNNPATIGLDRKRKNYFDIFLGYLGPDVSSSFGGLGSDSEADAFYMPAAGWVKKQNGMSYGVGIFAQGGMGTEYDASSFLALGSGDRVMSQVSVGRIIFPVSFDFSNGWTIGGSLDFVWANMDMKMALPTAQLTGLVSNSTPAWNTQLAGMAGQSWGRFDFADNSDFTGAAKGNGFAAKIGAVYQVNSRLSLGFAYHTETALGDLKDRATVSAGTGTSVAGSYYGDIAVNDFQWPSTYAIGLSYTPDDKWQVAADIKRINWADVMKNFRMTFTTGAEGELEVTMPQNWQNQTVYQAGVAYKPAAKHIVRVGFNIADNPVPDAYLNPLFPAIVEEHYMFGYGYTISPSQRLNGSLSVVPAVSATTPTGTEVRHSQLNWQLMYSRSF